MDDVMDDVMDDNMDALPPNDNRTLIKFKSYALPILKKKKGLFQSTKIKPSPFLF